MYETCIAIRAEHQTIFDIIIFVLKRYKRVEKVKFKLLSQKTSEMQTAFTKIWI